MIAQAILDLLRKRRRLNDSTKALAFHLFSSVTAPAFPPASLPEA